MINVTFVTFYVSEGKKVTKRHEPKLGVRTTQRKKTHLLFCLNFRKINPQLLRLSKINHGFQKCWAAKASKNQHQVIFLLTNRNENRFRWFEHLF